MIGVQQMKQNKRLLLFNLCASENLQNLSERKIHLLSAMVLSISLMKIHTITVTAFDATTDIDSPYQSAEYTLSRNDVNGAPITQVLEISNIQTEQINQLETLSTAGLEPLVNGGEIAV